VNVYRIATELQDVNARQIQALCIQYADNTLDREWPAMEKGEMTAEGSDIITRFGSW